MPTQSPMASVARDDQPGTLRGVVTLTLDTRQAQRLVKGRASAADKPAIIGLIGFAKGLNALWHGARADDPYADAWLIKVHEALTAADSALNDSLAKWQIRLTTIEAIHVTPSRSVRPVRIPLRFSNPYSYRGAQLIAVYDRLVRTALTAQHVGMLSRGDCEPVLAACGRSLRRAFLSPTGYYPMGITRDEVLRSTARAVQAQARMGELPAAIVNGVKRAPLAPVPRTLDLQASLPESRHE